MAPHLRLAPAPDSGDSVLSDPSLIGVVLADAHSSVRRALRGLLDGEPDIAVVGEAHDPASVERQLRLREPHVLVLDLGMRNGLTDSELIARLREHGPRTMIVALTMQDDPAFAQRALSVGAVGFVSKELADAELGPAIRAAARGEQFVSPRVSLRLDARRDGPAERSC